MCGFCTEGRVVELAKSLTLGKPWPTEVEKFWLFDACYLQESTNILLAIDQTESSLSRGINQFEQGGREALTRQDLVNFRSLFCRVLETLVTNGLESSIYQRLIDIAVVSKVVDIVCQLPVDFDQRLFTPRSSLRGLFHKDFFFTPHDMLDQNTFKADCTALLDSYISWWCDGEGLDNLEWDLFVASYPYIFLSYLLIEQQTPRHTLIGRLVTTNPHFGLTPDNFDGWLQRKASLILFDQLGIDAFLPYSDHPRPQLLYYLVVKNRLDENAKQRVKASILNSDYHDPTDKKQWRSSKKYLRIADQTDYWILEALSA
ncbi:MAG: hypothetical protein AAF485_17850 [Chloroflexota bacterium]